MNYNDRFAMVRRMGERAQERRARDTFSQDRDEPCSIFFTVPEPQTQQASSMAQERANILDAIITIAGISASIREWRTGDIRIPRIPTTEESDAMDEYALDYSRASDNNGYFIVPMD